MNTAIIVAGGSGRRLGGETPKQFLEVGGKPIIIICLEKFERHDGIDEIIAVCQPEYMALLKRQAAEFGISKLREIARAGDTRRESVLDGLKAVRDKDAVVLIHDAARPLVTARIISDNISGVIAHGAVVTAIPASDTIFRSVDGLAVDEVMNRGELYHAQTPQSFRYGIIMSAHLNTDIADATDDCRLALAAGHKVVPVPGDGLNFKITTRDDLARLKAIIEQS